MHGHPGGEKEWYHVETVTFTLFVTPDEEGEDMYIELEGGYNENALQHPEGTLWHEIYPNFCTSYNITWWNDNGNDKLDFCDHIYLMNQDTKVEWPYHVEEVATDIVVRQVGPPAVGGEAYPISKVSLLAPWAAVALVMAGGISWYILRRRRAQT